MNIRSFEDLFAIDSELASLFLCQDEAVNLIYAMENGIKKWVENHNKQYWEVVRYVCEQKGILGKLKKDRLTVRLTRNDFAKVLLKFCPNAVEKSETISALKSSMEHYQFASIWKELDKKPDSHIVHRYIKEVEDLLNGKPLIESHKEDSKPTLEDLMESYLRRDIDQQTDTFPKSVVCIRPLYGDICPAISVETYKSAKFFKERRPSYIEAYEFVDGELQEQKLNELVGQYFGKRVKLFIVSSFGLRPSVMKLAKERNIGYVRLNPNSEMTSEKYVLERSIEDHAKQQNNLEMLVGKKPMSTSLLVLDNSTLTPLLSDILSQHGIVVKDHRIINFPYLSEEEIESIANILTEKDVAAKIHSINNLDADLSLDPFSYAVSFGLSYSEEILQESQLGLLIIGNPNRVILNSIDESNPAKVFSTSNPKRRSSRILSLQEIIVGMHNEYSRKYNVRKRFTMAHELGHHILHSPLFKEQGIVSVGESENTLAISQVDSRRLEYQANKFASFLLMPEKLVRPLYNIYYSQYYGGVPRPLYYDPQNPETWKAYDIVVGNITNILQVSFQAMRIRLQSLGLLNTFK